MTTSGSFPAVITAAGNGTRFRPFSALVPKEMLPLGPTPAIHYVITECLHAGASEVIVVTRPDDEIIPCYVGILRRTGLPVHSVNEDLSHGYGNGTPLLTVVDRLAHCEVFAVAFGDDILLDEPEPGDNLAGMHRAALTGCDTVIAGQLINHRDTASFGIIDTQPDQPRRVLGIRQRPAPDTVNEPLAVVSRLILRPAVLDRLVPTELAAGEVDLGVAVGTLARDATVTAHRIAGHWVTVGDPRRYHDALDTYWRLHPHHPTPPGVSAWF